MIYKLFPECKDYLWGGSRLNDEFEKNIDLTPLAETWECSTQFRSSKESANIRSISSRLISS